MEKLRDYDHFIDKRGLLMNVKGSHHPEGRIRSSLIYLPTPFETGKQHIERGTHYARLIDDIGDVFCARNIKEIYYTDPVTADSFIAVPFENIDEHYSVLGERERIMKSFDRNHSIFDVLNKLKDMGISESSLGFFGTALAKVRNIQKGAELMSDIDIVIYGIENYQKWLDRYMSAMGSWNILPGMSRSRYRDFAGNFPFSFEEASKQFGERTCPYKLRIGSTKYDIRFAYADGEEPAEERYSPLEEVKMEGIVVENSASAYCPAVYELESNDKHLTRILTYRHHYRHLFNKGENVTVFGMLTNNPQRTVTLERHDFYIKDTSLKRQI